MTMVACAQALQVEPLPALTDNYIWLLHDGAHAWVVDPGDAQVVLRALQQRALTLQGVLITHHHGDHVGGVAELQAHSGCRVVGPAHEPLPVAAEPVDDGSVLTLLGRRWHVLAVPGHTKGHVAYVNEPVDGDKRRWLFCGDTLFAAGCGRLFEGTPAQMLASLDRLAQLPGDTLVCCAHEYTLANLRFAAAVEPANPALAQVQAEAQARRARGEPTLPSTLARERAINPFLRTREATVRAALRRQGWSPLTTDADHFAALRRWKDGFR